MLFKAKNNFSGDFFDADATLRIFFVRYNINNKQWGWQALQAWGAKSLASIKICVAS
jgi:hypothetical protein